MLAGGPCTDSTELAVVANGTSGDANEGDIQAAALQGTSLHLRDLLGKPPNRGCSQPPPTRPAVHTRRDELQHRQAGQSRRAKAESTRVLVASEAQQRPSLPGK